MWHQMMHLWGLPYKFMKNLLGLPHSVLCSVGFTPQISEF